MRKRLAVAACLAAALLTVVVVTDGPWSSRDDSAGVRAEDLGVSIPAADLHHDSVEAMDARLDEVAEIGARWLRTDANWAWIEPREEEWDWSELDALLPAARDRGLQVVLVLGTMPEWIRPPGAEDGYGPATDDQRAAFAGFAERLAKRYTGQVSAVEVWNEPNLDQFWAPNPDPRNYAELLRAVYPVLKAASPATRVLVGGTGGADTGDIDSVEWYQALYTEGAGPYFDVANMHPYQDWRAAAEGHPDTGEMRKVPQVRAIMKANGDSSKPMYGTEWGAPTSGASGVTEEEQAEVYRGGRELWVSRESGPLFVYYLRDRLPYGESTSRSPYWGVLRYDGTRKPAHDIVTAWAAAS